MLEISEISGIARSFQGSRPPSLSNRPTMSLVNASPEIFSAFVVLLLASLTAVDVAADEFCVVMVR